jgi:hypothetical protein
MANIHIPGNFQPGKPENNLLEIKQHINVTKLGPTSPLPDRMCEVNHSLA